MSGNNSGLNIGVVGAGNVTRLYFDNLKTLEGVTLFAVADLNMEAAQHRAREANIPHALTVDALLAHPDVDIVLNLTTPQAHAEIALTALRAGKHVYNEKPLALTCEEGQAILTLATENGLRVGAAPDTFLGAGLQTARHLLDSGAIGTPLAATAFMMSPGHESWHPNPDFYYQIGGGPMFDMGPYYLTALIALLGGVRRVTGSAQITRPTRTITSQPRHGQTIHVEVPTHVAGVLDFFNGTVATIITSFDVHAAKLPFIEIYGTQGTLSLPDPNTFGGDLRLRKAGHAAWEPVPLTRPYATQSRGVGVADMAQAIRGNRPHRASGGLAYHVLDIMHAIHEASKSGQHLSLTSAVARPAPLDA